jgi:D-arabinose 1-dehydrogenase-like Zn-dependent alcohol dehydrogenase
MTLMKATVVPEANAPWELRDVPKPGGRVAVLGIGGVGHLGIQFAKAAGYHVIAITHSEAKHALARELGADDVVADGAGLKA